MGDAIWYGIGAVLMGAQFVGTVAGWTNPATNRFTAAWTTCFGLIYASVHLWKALS